MKEKFEETREKEKSAVNQATQHPRIQENIMQKSKVWKGIVSACCVLCALSLTAFFGCKGQAAQTFSTGDRVMHMGWQHPALLGNQEAMETELFRCGWYGTVVGNQGQDKYKVRLQGFKSNCLVFLSALAEDNLVELIKENSKNQEEEKNNFASLGLCILNPIIGFPLSNEACKEIAYEGNICTEFYTMDPSSNSYVNEEIVVPGQCLEKDPNLSFEEVLKKIVKEKQ